MTEEDWLACADPTPMLPFLDVKASDRKLRLFAVACCRRIWTLLPAQSRKSVEVLEQIAEGLQVGPTAWSDARSIACAQKTRKARHAGDAVAVGIDGRFLLDFTRPRSKKHVVRFSAHVAALEAAYAASTENWVPADDNFSGRDQEMYTNERSNQVASFRDIFGNPFRPVTLDPNWLSPTVKSLAQSIYTDRAFDRMPILADALEDAGCDNQEILNHCRHPGEHCRGCWVVDLVSVR